MRRFKRQINLYMSTHKHRPSGRQPAEGGVFFRKYVRGCREREINSVVQRRLRMSPEMKSENGGVNNNEPPMRWPTTPEHRASPNETAEGPHFLLGFLEK